MQGETNRIILGLKRGLRSRGITYAMLARRISLSEPSVKRILSRGSLSLPRLERICEATGISMEELVRLEAGHIGAIEDDLAGIGRKVARNEVEECRLAGAIGADQPRDRAPLDPERAVVDGCEAAKMLADVPDVDDCVEGHPVPVLTEKSRPIFRPSPPEIRGIWSHATVSVNLDRLVKSPRETRPGEG